MISNEQALVILLEGLKRRGKLPLNMEFSSEQEHHWVTAFNHLNAEFIHESVATGFDIDEKLATLKCLTEYCERMAFIEGASNNDPTCNTERSDGIAAFPISYDLQTAKRRARENALNEAIERYAWATWWDDVDTMSQVSEVENYPHAVKIIQNHVSIEKMITVKPFIRSHFHELIINVFVLSDGGVVCGGACGAKNDSEKTQLRAVSEALRHALAIKKMKEENASPTSFYEKRLLFFSSPKGQTVALNRLSIAGKKSVILPSLKIDGEIKYSLSDLVYVHRVLFENQPPFVGGALERLCI